MQTIIQVKKTTIKNTHQINTINLIKEKIVGSGFKFLKHN